MEKLLINHKEFFRFVLDGIIELSNEAESNVFASWKVGGQDFYIYGRNPTMLAPDKGDSPAPRILSTPEGFTAAGNEPTPAPCG